MKPSLRFAESFIAALLWLTFSALKQTQARLLDRAPEPFLSHSTSDSFLTAGSQGAGPACELSPAGGWSVGGLRVRPGHPEKRQRLARRGTFRGRLWTAIVTSHLGRRLLIKSGFYWDVKIFCGGDRASCVVAATAWAEVSGA